MNTGGLNFHNAHIWTGAQQEPREVSGFRVHDGVIVDLFSSEDPMPSGPGIDLGGHFVSPGLIDAHMHVLAGGESLLHIDLTHVSGPDEFEDVLADAHRALDEDCWLIASGWSENRWDPPVIPDKSWLRACGDRPVVCWRMDHHAAVVNDAVLRQLSLPDDATLEGEGGRVVRDQAGNPTGLLQEAAAWRYLIPLIPALSKDSQSQALRSAHQTLLKFGLTGIRTLEYRRDLWVLQEQPVSRGGLRTSVVLLDRTLPLDLDWLEEPSKRDGLTIIGCKTFVDGTLGSRTARLRSPYADDPSNQGVFTEHMLDGQLDEWMGQVAAAGLSPVLHAIGDAAVLASIDAITARGLVREASIEHAELVTPDVMDAVAAAPGIRLSMQPLHRADDATYATEALGPARAAFLSPFASLQGRGALLAFGSDWPVVSCDPLPGMAAAILGQDTTGRDFHTQECLSPEAVLRAYTIDAAQVAGLEGSGQLSEQSLADFVVWDQDPLEANWAHSPPTIRATFVGGELVAGALEEIAS